MSDTPRTETVWEARHKTDWDLAWEVYCLTQQLERELTKALEHRDRAMELLKQAEPPLGGLDAYSDMSADMSAPDAFAHEIEQLEKEIEE